MTTDWPALRSLWGERRKQFVAEAEAITNHFTFDHDSEIAAALNDAFPEGSITVGYASYNDGATLVFTAVVIRADVDERMLWGTWPRDAADRRKRAISAITGFKAIQMLRREGRWPNPHELDRAELDLFNHGGEDETHGPEM